MIDNDYYHVDIPNMLSNIGTNLDRDTNKLDKYTSIGSPPQYEVDVKHIPTDWINIAATVSAAFFGALAAFFLNGIYEIHKERECHRTAINSAMNGFIINLMHLINFKNQFLSNFNKEFEILREHASNYQTIQSNPELKEEFKVKILPMLHSIAAKDPTFNGVFIKWDEHEYVENNAPETLGFFSDYSPDDIRIFVLAREQIKGVVRTISSRNKCWEKYESRLALGPQPDSTVMLPMFELLSLRNNIQQFVNLGLVLLRESVERIDKYNKIHYPKRFILWRWLLPERVTVRGHFQKDALLLIPDRKEYIDLLEPPIDK